MLIYLNNFFRIKKILKNNKFNFIAHFTNLVKIRKYSENENKLIKTTRTIQRSIKKPSS